MYITALLQHVVGVGEGGEEVGFTQSLQLPLPANNCKSSDDFTSPITSESISDT